MMRLGARILFLAVGASIVAGITYVSGSLTVTEVFAANPPLTPNTAKTVTATLEPAYVELTEAVPAAQVTVKAPQAAAKPAPKPVVRNETAVSPRNLPTRLRIPSISLDVPVIEVGLTKNNEMDVPDGSTNNVGWYKYGTVPGQKGSAVMDAHVYAAFKNLRNAKIGDDVYVEMDNGSKLHFTIEASMVYSLAEMPLKQIFNRTDTVRLNFITCAREFLPAINTYSHRLVVYTTFVGESS